jgi:hypothetical protein
MSSYSTFWFSALYAFFCVAGLMLFISRMAECWRNQYMSSVYFTVLRCHFQTDFLFKSCIQVISLQCSWNFFRLDKWSTWWILQKWVGRAWTGFVWFSIDTTDILFVNEIINVHFQKSAENFLTWMTVNFSAWIFLLKSVFISTRGTVVSVFPVHMLTHWRPNFLRKKWFQDRFIT